MRFEYMDGFRYTLECMLGLRQASRQQTAQYVLCIRCMAHARREPTEQHWLKLLAFVLSCMCAPLCDAHILFTQIIESVNSRLQYDDASGALHHRMHRLSSFIRRQRRLRPASTEMEDAQSHVCIFQHHTEI